MESQSLWLYEVNDRNRLLDGLKVTAASPGRVKFEVEVMKEHTVSPSCSLFFAFETMKITDWR